MVILLVIPALAETIKRISNDLRGTGQAGMKRNRNWELEEAAILLEALIRVRNHELERKEAIAEVSTRLRNYAILQGYEISETYRNEKGINMQMMILETVYTNGEVTYKLHPNRWSKEIVEIYRDQPEIFQKLLSDFKRVEKQKDRR